MSDRLRAIDALIAEHVFGFVWMQGDGNNNLLRPENVRHGKAFGMREGKNPERESPLPTAGICAVPAYSTDPAASKQARDKMLGLGWTVTVEGWKSFDHDEFCVSLRIYEDQTWQCQKDIRGEDEFLCVALAILAALQIEVPE